MKRKIVIIKTESTANRAAVAELLARHITKGEYSKYCKSAKE